MIPNSISTKELASLLNSEREMQQDHPELLQWEKSREMVDQAYETLVKTCLDNDHDLDAVMDRMLERILEDQLQTCFFNAASTTEIYADQQTIDKDRLIWAEEKGKIQAMLAIWGTTRF